MIKIALQSDNPEDFNTRVDSSLALALEAQERNYEVFHYFPHSLTLEDHTLKAFTRKLSLEPHKKPKLSEPSWQNLNTFHAVLIRQDPPFNITYITSTYLLEHLPPSVKVVNNPRAVRDFPEKIPHPSLLPLFPPTLISKDIHLIRNFAHNHNHNIIIKPLYGNGGRGVFHVKPHDKNIAVILESLTAIEDVPVIAQAFLPAISEGDKRIILIHGKPVGAINRIAPENDHRSNLHIGGTAHPAELTPHNHKICQALTPFLIQNHIPIAGIDVVGHYLTEINITSPTGFQEIQQFTGINPASLFWDNLNLQKK